MSIPFLMWYDDNPKHTLVHKIREACEAYQARMGIAPNIVLISSDDGPVPSDALVGIQIQTKNIRRNTIWVGRDG